MLGIDIVDLVDEANSENWKAASSYETFTADKMVNNSDKVVDSQIII